MRWVKRDPVERDVKKERAPVDGKVDHLSYEERRATATMLKAHAPSYSTCGRCDVPWKFITEHVTRDGRNGGGFPLCESCWRELATPEARMPYYRALWAIWTLTDVSGTLDQTRWDDIEHAVNSGL